MFSLLVGVSTDFTCYVLVLISISISNQVGKKLKRETRKFVKTQKTSERNQRDGLRRQGSAQAGISHKNTDFTGEHMCRGTVRKTRMTEWMIMNKQIQMYEWWITGKLIQKNYKCTEKRIKNSQKIQNITKYFNLPISTIRNIIRKRKKIWKLKCRPGGLRNVPIEWPETWWEMFKRTKEPTHHCKRAAKKNICNYCTGLFFLVSLFLNCKVILL